MNGPILPNVKPQMAAQTHPAESSPIAASDRPRYQVDTVSYSRTNQANVVASLERYFRDRPPRNYVCVSNVHTTVERRADAHLRGIQNNSFLTIADGQPLIFYGRISGVSDIERIMGTTDRL